MSRSNRFVSSLMVFVAICLAGAIRLGFSGISPRPPLGIISPAHQRLVAALGSDGRVTARYTVTNRGGRDLMLGESQSSCGCSVASVEPRVLKPGQSGVVTVQATTPGAGEHDVAIGITTNAEPPSPLTLRLTLVGSQSVPYVAFNSGPLQLGPARIGAAPESIRIDTRELPGPNPWIVEAACDVPGVEIAGKVEETHEVGGVLIRNYRFLAEVKDQPPTGQVSGEIAFRDSSRKVVFTLPVHGLVRPAVYAAPSSLYASYDPGSTDQPSLTVTLIDSDPDHHLEVTPSEEISVKVLAKSREVDRITFAVSPRPEVSETVAISLTFSTNNPGAAIVRVPVTFRVDR